MEHLERIRTYLTEYHNAYQGEMINKKEYEFEEMLSEFIKSLNKLKGELENE